MEKMNAASVQKHLDIKDIREDMVILKDGGYRAILITNSINFDLKSEDERIAVIEKFQDFLNALDFPVQILIVSRRFDLGEYIEKLQTKQREQENELLRMQTSEYINFIQSLTDLSNIMTESFYLVVPYNPSALKKIGFLKKLPFFGNDREEEPEQKSTEEIKTNLWQRVEYVATTLRSCGIKSAPLKTNELIELFYKLYNPSAKEGLELGKAKEMRME